MIDRYTTTRHEYLNDPISTPCMDYLQKFTADRDDARVPVLLAEFSMKINNERLAVLDLAQPTRSPASQRLQPRGRRPLHTTTSLMTTSTTQLTISRQFAPSLWRSARSPAPTSPFSSRTIWMPSKSSQQSARLRLRSLLVSTQL